MPAHNKADLYVELGILNNEISNLSADIKELKQLYHRDIQDIRLNLKQLQEFMYKIQGGKAWLFSLLTISATVGALLSALTGHFFTIGK